ncbi:MAG: methyltransferase [Acidobacteria bacterium]|nr:MAG: methyltransferase [Acidobacteriota bacterium]
MTQEEAMFDEGAGAMPPQAQLAQLINGYLNTQLIYVVAKLGVPDLLKDGAKTSAELAARTGAHAPTLRRVMRGLVRCGLVVEDPEGRYSLTPVGACLQSDARGSMRDLAIANGEDCYAAWEGLLGAVRSGDTPFDRVHGKPFFAYLEQNRDAGNRFDGFMAAMAAETARAVVEVCDFSPYHRIVDVGGGRGVVLGSILAATPGSVGVLYDRAAVVAAARDALESLGVASRCRVEEGNFFVAVPPGGDAYVLAQILHDWDDERSIQILRNCRAAMDDHARLFVVERIMPDHADPSSSDVIDMDLVMLVLLGGRERTAAELRDLLHAGGFRLERIVTTSSPQSVLEASPC